MKNLLMDSEFCSMGRWISVIVGKKYGLKLYEAKDLIGLLDEGDLSLEEYSSFYEGLEDYQEGPETLAKDPEYIRIRKALEKAILRATDEGPCIIHECGAREVLEGKKDFLTVHIYNSSLENKFHRAVFDKKYENISLDDKDMLKDIIYKEDKKRRLYHDAMSDKKWGDKANYDICLDSETLTREKCAEILITAMGETQLTKDAAKKLIEENFGKSE